MSFISEKTINGIKRHYLERSVRFPDGKAKKFSIYLKDYDPAKFDPAPYENVLDMKIHKELIEFGPRRYKSSVIFDAELLRRLECIRVDYHRIVKSLTKNQIRDLIDRFTVNFTYESNAIEGSSLTLKDVAIVIQENRVLKGKDLREVYETLNTREAMQLLFENRFRVTERDIIKIHKILVKNTGVETGYKKFPNYILGRNVRTTEPEHVKKEMDAIIMQYSKDDRLHPLQKAVIFHGHLERIHPFDDGNGRVGRFLTNVILLNNGYPPFIIRKTQRISYFGCLEVFDRGHQDKLSRFFIEKYKMTYEKFFKVYVKYL
jgi:Fic family protein